MQRESDLLELDAETKEDEDFSGLSESEREALARNIENIKHNLGPHGVAALESPDVFELILSQSSELWVDTVSQGLVPLTVDGRVQTMLPQSAHMLMLVVAPMLGSEITEDCPILEGELPLGGHRFEGLIPPIVKRPIFTIRKKAGVIFTLDHYVRKRIMTMQQADGIRAAIRERLNIVVFGGTSSGKTTLTNAVLAEIAVINPDHRVIIIEDTRELECPVRCVEYLRAKGNVDFRALLKATLRLRPDRIVVGEVRDGSALDMLKMWNTGHPGGIGTGHADSPEEGLERLDEMVQEVRQTSAAPLIGRAIDLILFIQKDPTHQAKRRLTHMLRVKGYDRTRQEYITERV